MDRVVRFAGTTAVVTGGASGIGRGMAEAFLAAGSNVVIADIDQAALDATATELGVLGVRVDVADQDSVTALAERAVAEYGEVHVVCNNAGVGPFAAMDAMSLDDWRWVLDVNLWGVIHGVRAFLPVLKRNDDWGHVVNTSSISVVLTPPNVGAYVASKAAVLGLTEVLAAELKAAGSRVGATALLPGAVTTNIKNSLRSRPATGDSALYEVDLAASRLRFRFLQPREVGELVLDAILTDEVHVATHDEYRSQIIGRAERIARSAVPGSS